MSDKKILNQEELSKLKEKGYEPRGVGFAKNNKFVSGSEVDTAVEGIRAQKSIQTHDEKFSLLTNIVAKNSARVKSLSDTATQHEEKIAAIESTVATMKKKFSLITNVLAKNAGRVKSLQAEDEKPTQGDDSTKESITSLNNIHDNIQAVNASLLGVNSLLQTALQEKNAAAYKQQEALGEANKPSISTSAPKREKGDQDKSLFDLLKDLFLNPAVIAAVSGIVYLFLPKDIKEKIVSFFSGFMTGITDSSGEMDKFKVALIAAAAGLATYFGASMLQSIGEAIATMTALVIKSKNIFGSFKKKGVKGIAKEAGQKALSVAKSPVGLGIGVAAATGAVLSTQESKPESQPSPAASGGDQTSSSPTTSTSPAPAPAPTPSTGTGLTAGGGQGLKAGGGEGLKAPPMSGDDKPIMDMIKRHEGVRTRPYKDSLGLWTVGVGHLIGDGKSLPQEYNREFSMNEVDTLFAKDYQEHKAAAQKIPGFDKVGNSAKAALIDLTFNMGPAWYKKWPRFSKALAEGDTQSAAASLEDSKWYTQVGNRAKEIVSLIRSDSPAGKTDIASSANKGVAEGGVGSNKGTDVIKSSESVEVASAAPRVTNNNIGGGRTMGEKEGTPPSPSIPSPIANRGSLNYGTKHSSAYG